MMRTLFQEGLEPDVLAHWSGYVLLLASGAVTPVIVLEHDEQVVVCANTNGKLIQFSSRNDFHRRTCYLQNGWCAVDDRFPQIVAMSLEPGVPVCYRKVEDAKNEEAFAVFSSDKPAHTGYCQGLVDAIDSENVVALVTRLEGDVFWRSDSQNSEIFGGCSDDGDLTEVLAEGLEGDNELASWANTPGKHVTAGKRTMTYGTAGRTLELFPAYRSVCLFRDLSRYYRCLVKEVSKKSNGEEYLIPLQTQGSWLARQNDFNNLCMMDC